jgi:hypothetical protein
MTAANISGCPLGDEPQPEPTHLPHAFVQTVTISMPKLGLWLKFTARIHARRLALLGRAPKNRTRRPCRGFGRLGSARVHNTHNSGGEAGLQSVSNG